MCHTLTFATTYSAISGYPWTALENFHSFRIESLVTRYKSPSTFVRHPSWLWCLASESKMFQCSLRIYPLSFAVRKTATRSSTAERAMTAWWCIFGTARRSWTLSGITRLGTNDCSVSRIRSSLCPFGCYLPISLYAWHQTRTLKNSLTSKKIVSMAVRLYMRSKLWTEYTYTRCYSKGRILRIIVPISFSQWLDLL